MDINQPRVIAPEFRSGYNNTGAPILKGTIVKLNVATPNRGGDIVKAAAATDTFYGVAAADIPTGSYGDVQVRGTALVLAAGALALTVGQVTSDGNGKAVAAASGNTLLGLLTSKADLADELVEVELTIGGEAN